ncbi:MAG: hypothetical protein LBD17_04560 [Endomicrobium sp.]|jgi:hypothetical protein|nr:hypothetical protein [Endomicrobium sp.]
MEKTYFDVYGKEELHKILFGKIKYFYLDTRKDYSSFYINFHDDDFLQTRKSLLIKIDLDYVEHISPVWFEKPDEMFEFEEGWKLEDFYVYKINKIVLNDKQN